MIKATIAIVLVFLLKEGNLLGITKHYNINRPKNTKDIQYPYRDQEILTDIGLGILYSFSGGVGIIRGNIPGGILGTVNGAKNFIKAIEKYQENLRFERDFDQKNFNGYELIEKEYDQGYDAYDNTNQ